jgi:starch synthase (maltosyl-transferring)
LYLPVERMEARTMKEGPRIYNLFPLLAGKVQDWESHLPRIAGMGFNWVFLNPFHYPGFSGSLYAVKDYYRLHPLLTGEGDPDAQLRAFVRQAEHHGLSVMVDLVINHTAKDSVLAERHPEWFAREADGSVRSPFAVDPDDPTQKTVWGDLGEIDYSPRPARTALLDYWKQVTRHYVQLGFHGFRCDAAYKVPGEVWGELIRAAREEFPHTEFFAETLGAQLEEVQQLHNAGFDYFFNSAKWWDFSAEWLLEQYEMFRKVAPSIAFPESHDTERLAAETNGDAQQSRLRYAFAAFFSTGVMMPMGYEYGFRRKLHVVETRPEHWEEPSFDLSDFIREVNAVKARTPALNEEGPQQRFTPPGAPVVGLVRDTEQGGARVAALINTDPTHRVVPVGPLETSLQTPAEHIEEITPQREPEALTSGRELGIDAQDIRLFRPRGAGKDTARVKKKAS